MDLKNQNKLITESIKLISSAEVPLPNVNETSFNIFKSYIGSRKHIAVIIKPSLKTKITNLRIHSACFTGDIFHSLKCDCGEQLNQSINYMIRNKGGIVLYLDQEGRGIGLVNKIRAYELQDAGLNTVEANEKLGFAADERDYSYCKEMLSSVGVSSVRLMTNNPAKIKGLEDVGIQVSERIAIETLPTKENKSYLEVKSKQMGHMLKGSD